LFGGKDSFPLGVRFRQVFFVIGGGLGSVHDC
jgi:hypothetical protein